MRRNEMMIESREDALEWLEWFKHTITDEPVLKVIEQLKRVVEVECDDCPFLGTKIINEYQIND